MQKWQLHEAKNKLSSLIDTAMHGKAQSIMRHGRTVAVLISAEEYRILKKQKLMFRDFLLKAPKIDDFDIKRVKGKSRGMEL